MKAFIDCETCGFHGMAVTLQYAFDEGEIKIWEFWREPIQDSLALIKKITECEVIGFNLAFDWFHLCKIYTTFAAAAVKLGLDAFPDEHIDEMAVFEKAGRDGPCLKPVKALDLMTHARKTEFQITMERSDIRIRKVPTGLAWSLAAELEKRIVLDPILFARKKNRLSPNWSVHDIKRNDGTIHPDFKDLVLKFKPSMALKALAAHALNIDPEEILTFEEVEIDKAHMPYEVGYAPYALAISSRAKGWKVSKRSNKKIAKTAKFTWPAVINHHILHWAYNEQARTYATKDVEYTRKLYHYFNCPESDDDDSVLTCMVGAVRWRGYAIDVEGIKELRAEAIHKRKVVPTAPKAVKKWIMECLSPEEQSTFTDTGKVTLQNLANQDDKCPCGPCSGCNFTGKLPIPESATRAAAVLEARFMGKEIELYDKLLLAGRFHASFKVIGALSGRMAGADQLNPQGIKRTKTVRSKFPLVFGNLRLYGGDFSAFEVVLADAAYHDLALRKDLQTCEKCRDVQVRTLPKPIKAKDFLDPAALAVFIDWNIKADLKKAEKDSSFKCRTNEQIADTILKTFACPKCGDNKRMKIHALFGMDVYTGMTYDEIKATDGTADDKYNKSKSAVFAMIYGGEGYTLMTRLGVPIEIANEAYLKFCKRYPGVGLARKRVIDAFCSIRQEGGIGSAVVWNDPAEYVESLLGFRRYFILENKITEAIFKLAEDPPEEWKNLKIKVRRRDREQTIGGAVQSALFGTAFQIQAGNMRAAANHEIQSTGAQITKHVQRRIWDVQPPGVHEWLVQPCNIHDQVLTPTHPSVVNRVNQIVFDSVESYRDKVPLIEFEYKAMQTWASK